MCFVLGSKTHEENVVTKLAYISLFFTSIWINTSSINAAEFFNYPGTKSLLVMGETVAGDFEEFQKFTAEEEIDTVILRGPGGALEEAFRIANYVQDSGFDTVVASKGECASACSLIFIAGKNRTMQEGSTLGFHLPFLLLSQDEINDYCDNVAPRKKSTDLLSRTQEDLFRMNTSNVTPTCLEETYRLGFLHLSLFSKIMKQSDISDEVFDVMLSTPPESMKWYTSDEAAKLNLTNLGGH